jgi:hypothetical protein
MDNTYYAILTLNLLEDDWSGYSIQKSNTIDYIQELQCMNELHELRFGGFRADNVSTFWSLGPGRPYYDDETLISSYYCIESLRILNFLPSINIDNFHEFINTTYQEEFNYFKLPGEIIEINKSNIVATAYGLYLANLTDYMNIDENGILGFLKDHRKSNGLWKSSTNPEIEHYELLNTFWVIRSIYQAGYIDIFTTNEKNIIASGVNLHQQYDYGYALLSEEYTMLSTLYTIVSAFHYMERDNDLGGSYLDSIASAIEDAYLYEEGATIQKYQFRSMINTGSHNLRSYPLEFFSKSAHNLSTNIGFTNSHESTYFALTTLQKLHMLYQFKQQYDLHDILDDIISSQFVLGESYSNHGGFLPGKDFSYYPEQTQNKLVFFQYTYYAIKALKLLCDELNLGTILDLESSGLDILSLQYYIMQHQQFTGGTSYFAPKFPCDVEEILESTYYMISIANMINMVDLHPDKILKFLTEHINYSNIKNVYYCYKLVEELDLDYEFDINKTNSLVQTIYSDDLKDYFLDLKRDRMEHSVLLWITEMGDLSQLEKTIQIKAEFPSFVQLGSTIMLTVQLEHIIYSDISGISVRFESDTLEQGLLTKISGMIYQKEIEIPQGAHYYPSVSGIIKAIRGATIIEQPIIIETYYPSGVSEEDSSNNNNEDLPEPEYEETYTMALPLMIVIIAVPSIIVFISEKKKRRVISKKTI